MICSLSSRLSTFPLGVVGMEETNMTFLGTLKPALFFLQKEIISSSFRVTPGKGTTTAVTPSPPNWIVHPDHGCLHDLPLFKPDPLDFHGGDILSPCFDHVFLPIDKIEKPLLVEPAEVLRAYCDHLSLVALNETGYRFQVSIQNASGSVEASH